MTEHERKMVRIRRVEKTVSRYQRLKLIYQRGGARIYSPVQRIIHAVAAGVPWSDCSGWGLLLAAVADVPLKDPAGWTGTAVQEGEAGESEYFTFFIKDPYEHEGEGHMIVRLRHHPRWRRLLGLAAKWRWTECGGSDNPQAGGGPTWFKPTDARIAEFPYRRRFPGL